MINIKIKGNEVDKKFSGEDIEYLTLIAERYFELVIVMEAFEKLTGYEFYLRGPGKFYENNLMFHNNEGTFDITFEGEEK